MQSSTSRISMPTSMLLHMYSSGRPVSHRNGVREGLSNGERKRDGTNGDIELERDGAVGVMRQV